MPTIKLQIRRDTSTQWFIKNPILLPGEIGFETDTGKLKIGRTTSQVWNNIPYISIEASAHQHSITDIQATGNPSSSTFLRGDGQWVEVSSGSGSSSENIINLGWVKDHVTIDAFEGNKFIMILTGDIVLNIINLPSPPYSALIRLEQGGEGDYQVTWDPIFRHPINNDPPVIGSLVGYAEWFLLEYIYEGKVEVFKADGPYSPPPL